jgi:phospholipid N-methyltransferase
MDLTLLQALARDPGQVGTILPSSRWLARSMAQLARRYDRGGAVLEAGAGTGALTAALIDTFGCNRLTVIERDAEMSAHLHARFPGLRILHSSLEASLGKLAPRPQGALLVSSIPWRSLTEAQSRPILRKLERFLIGGGTVIQFSYGLRAPFAAPEGFGWQSFGREWRNIPPAKLWVLRADEA